MEQQLVVKDRATDPCAGLEQQSRSEKGQSPRREDISKLSYDTVMKGLLAEVDDHRRVFDRKQQMLVNYLLRRQEEQDQLIRRLKMRLQQFEEGGQSEKQLLCGSQHLRDLNAQRMSEMKVNGRPSFDIQTPVKDNMIWAEKTDSVNNFDQHQALAIKRTSETVSPLRTKRYNSVLNTFPNSTLSNALKSSLKSKGTSNQRQPTPNKQENLNSDLDFIVELKRELSYARKVMLKDQQDKIALVTKLREMKTQIQELQSSKSSREGHESLLLEKKQPVIKESTEVQTEAEVHQTKEMQGASPQTDQVQPNIPHERNDNFQQKQIKILPDEYEEGRLRENILFWKEKVDILFKEKKDSLSKQMDQHRLIRNFETQIEDFRHQLKYKEELIECYQLEKKIDESRKGTMVNTERKQLLVSTSEDGSPVNKDQLREFNASDLLEENEGLNQAMLNNQRWALGTVESSIAHTSNKKPAFTQETSNFNTMSLFKPDQDHDDQEYLVEKLQTQPNIADMYVNSPLQSKKVCHKQTQPKSKASKKKYINQSITNKGISNNYSSTKGGSKAKGKDLGHTTSVFETQRTNSASGCYSKIQAKDEREVQKITQRNKIKQTRSRDPQRTLLALEESIEKQSNKPYSRNIQMSQNPSKNTSYIHKSNPSAASQRQTSQNTSKRFIQKSKANHHIVPKQHIKKPQSRILSSNSSFLVPEVPQSYLGSAGKVQTISSQHNQGILEVLEKLQHQDEAGGHVPRQVNDDGREQSPMSQIQNILEAFRQANQHRQEEGQPSSSMIELQTERNTLNLDSSQESKIEPSSSFKHHCKSASKAQSSVQRQPLRSSYERKVQPGIQTLCNYQMLKNTNFVQSNIEHAKKATPVTRQRKQPLNVNLKY